MALRGGIAKRRRSGQKGSGSSRSYGSMMKTLLLQNQQIIIQQQNMMFMVMKQFHPEAQLPPIATNTTTTTIQSPHDQTSSQMQLHLNQMQPQPLHHNHLQQQHPSQQQQQHHLHHHQTQLHLSSQQEHEHHHQHSLQEQQGPTTNSNGNGTTNATHTNGHLDQQEQQRIANLQNSLNGFMTPAQSEQDPISENGKSDQGPSDSDALSALLDGDSLLTNNLLYNPCTDVGSITPYKNNHGQEQHQSGSQGQQLHHHHSIEHQTPSYYSSGCESLSTPRVEQQCQPVNISQNVVKNLNNSFKSPSKPQINVQILSGSATREMRKAKIIQSMNISEFLRQVHHDDAPKGATQ